MSRKTAVILSYDLNTGIYADKIVYDDESETYQEDINEAFDMSHGTFWQLTEEEARRVVEVLTAELKQKKPIKEADWKVQK